MTDYPIPASGTSTITINVSGTNSATGPSTAANGAGAGTLVLSSGSSVSGSFDITGGTVDVAGSSGGATFNVSAATIIMDGSNNGGSTVNFVSGVNSMIQFGADELSSGNFNGIAITNFNDGDSIGFGTSDTISDVNYSGGQLTFTLGGVSHSVSMGLASGANPNFSVQTVNGQQVIVQGDFPVACFVTGARIRTARGEVAVERLKVGDLAVTASGARRRIVWIGSRTIRRPSPQAWPVRVRAGAFRGDLPARDLLLSPGHAVCVQVMDEVFIPVSALVNGATIAREQVDEVTYWHVELESHDVLLSEGLGSESYMDCGNRRWFEGGEGAPDAERLAESLTCYARPYLARGPVVQAVRERLLARAEAQGWTHARGLDLHLLADGRRVDPDVDGDMARFLFPARAEDVVLASRTFCPWNVGVGDPRELGVALKSLAVRDGLRVARDIPLGHAALGQGFHRLEGQGERAWRWTDGRARLPAELWSGCKGVVMLSLTFGPDYGYWEPPTDLGVSAPFEPAPLRAVG